MQRKLQFIATKFDNVRFCVRPLCGLRLSAALDVDDIRHLPHWELWYRPGGLSAPPPLLSKGRMTASKEVNTMIRGVWRVFYADGEIGQSQGA